MNERFLHINQAAKILQTSESTVRRWIKTKKLPCYRLGAEYKFLESELNKYIISKKVN